jgi:probable F420-dependent oxidoreductase
MTGMSANATGWGITVPFDGVTLDAHPAMYRWLADLGYTDLWSVEAAGADGVTPLALAAAVEPRLALGTAILSAFTRGPALLAQTAAAMAECAPGRFALGIGASSDVIVGRWNGIRYERPYARVRDTVRFLRAALAGEKVVHDYDTFSVEGFRLARVPRRPPQLLVAALRERMLRLAGEEADGVILNWVSPADVARVVPYVREANADARIVARVMVCPSTDADAVRRLIRPLVTSYLTVPVYEKYHAWLGRGAVLGPMWAAWAAGDRRAAVEAVPDEVVDDFCVHGTPEECQARLDEYVTSGVTTPVVALIPLDGDVRGAVAALAPTPVRAG